MSVSTLEGNPTHECKWQIKDECHCTPHPIHRPQVPFHVHQTPYLPEAGRPGNVRSQGCQDVVLARAILSILLGRYAQVYLMTVSVGT